MFNFQDNLKGLVAVRRQIVIDSGPMGSAPAPISELQLGILVDYALDRLGITKSPDRSDSPILAIYLKVRGVGAAPNQAVAIGTSLSVLERVLLPRTFIGWPIPGRLPNAVPTNATVQSWTTDATASVVQVTTASDQVLADLGRLLDSFMGEWSAANP